MVRTALPNYNIIMDILLRISTSGFTVVYTNQMKNAKVKQCPTKGDDTHSNKLRQYYGTTFLRHNIARLS